jgi:hypothetical protein
MRPLADLIYTVRENAWEDPATKPAGALGLYRGLPLTDLITAAAAGWNVIEVP